MSSISMIPDDTEIVFLKQRLEDFTFEAIEYQFLVDDSDLYIMDDEGRYIVPDRIKTIN